MKLRIMPLGDSITRGSYLALYESGPLAGQPIGLPNPAGGGWRKPLQDKLRAAGVAFEFVGELDYGAYGRAGVVDPAFDPRHHGLAGFGNHGILTGGVVPTPQDVLAARGATEIRVPDIGTVLGRHKPDVILLMSGSNGFDAGARERLIRAILEHSDGLLLVATLPPQGPPRQGFEQVEAYNASLAGVVAELSAAGKRVAQVDVHAALTTADLLPDGVHPNREGLEKIAAEWWRALQLVLKSESPASRRGARTIREPARELPVVGEYDVVVCGGGPAGVGAALAAARRGAATLLLENQICLGGMATAGLVNRLGPYHDQERIILGGIAWEVLRLLVGRGLAQEPILCAPGNWMDYWLVFDPEGMKLVLDELLLAAGVNVRLHAQVVAPVLSGNAVQGVILESKSGREAALGTVVIDATGDGDVAARAGAPYSLGRAGDQLTQPCTLFFKCLNMDWPKAREYVKAHHAELVALAQAEQGNDFILAGTDSYLHPEETYFNCLHEHGIDGTDGRAISRAAVNLRRKLWGNLEVLRRHVPGCERLSLSASAAALGVRETRRIGGDYELQVEDVLAGRQFEDQVYRYACFVDIHEPRAGEKPAYANRALPPGASYGVPYRCLLPRGVENLLVAGRCLSASHEALASVRMMPSCMAMGEAAGAAAALAVKAGVPPRQVAVGALRSTLAEHGVVL